ncbi:hypothetical protein FPOAC2_09886 [Fusarium poae]
MKFSILTTAFLAASVPPAQAEFDVYMVERKNAAGSEDKEWQIWDRDERKTCMGVHERKTFETYSDVSHYTGVRCKGACDFSDSARYIDQLEMHLDKKNPAYHLTIYKDRKYGMYGLNGTKYGDCSVVTGEAYHCERQIYLGLVKETVNLHPKFHCKSQFTAKEILGL